MLRPLRVEKKLLGKQDQTYPLALFYHIKESMKHILNGFILLALHITANRICYMEGNTKDGDFYFSLLFSCFAWHSLLLHVALVTLGDEGILHG